MVRPPRFERGTFSSGGPRRGSTPADSCLQNPKDQAFSVSVFRQFWNGSTGVVGNFSITFGTNKERKRGPRRQATRDGLSLSARGPQWLRQAHLPDVGVLVEAQQIERLPVSAGGQADVEARWWMRKDQAAARAGKLAQVEPVCVKQEQAVTRHQERGERAPLPARQS